MQDIHGQDRALGILQRAIQSGRLAHTWIFHGPSGVGKRRTALALAQTMLCDYPKQVPAQGVITSLPEDYLITLPCGSCTSCRSALAGNHPDIHNVSRTLAKYHKAGARKSNALPISVIRGEITGDDSPERRVEAKIARKSFCGKGRFFIIDEADLMETPAQNCLLKTLEEPPAEAYLILISSSPGTLLSTIRSRSQMLEFTHLPDELIAQVVVPASLAPADADLLVRLCDGSLGEAEARLAEITYASGGTPDSDEDESDTDFDESEGEYKSRGKTTFNPLALVGWAHHISRICEGLAKGKLHGASAAEDFLILAKEAATLRLKRDKLTPEAQASRDGITDMLRLMGCWLSDQLRYQAGLAVQAPMPGQPLGLSVDALEYLLGRLRGAETHIEMNVRDKMVITTLMLEWQRALQYAIAVK
ncbi:MAG: hypothetical protein WCJ97_01175 [Phycisphaerae bacterium]